MKRLAIFALIMLLLFSACRGGETTTSMTTTGGAATTVTRVTTETTETTEKKENREQMSVIIRAGGAEFEARLYENDTVRELFSMLPLTVDMSELNGNEKYAYLERELPCDEEKPGHIRAGDIMLYGSNCLVIFYESFESSYSYTPIGRIEDVSSLKQALGRGAVRVSVSRY